MKENGETRFETERNVNEHLSIEMQVASTIRCGLGLELGMGITSKDVLGKDVASRRFRPVCTVAAEGTRWPVPDVALVNKRFDCFELGRTSVSCVCVSRHTEFIMDLVRININDLNTICDRRALTRYTSEALR